MKDSKKLLAGHMSSAKKIGKAHDKSIAGCPYARRATQPHQQRHTRAQLEKNCVRQQTWTITPCFPVLRMTPTHRPAAR